MREAYEKMPVFGLETVLADRRLIARLKGMLKNLLTVKGILLSAAALYFIIYVFVYATATTQSWNEFLSISASILVVVVPIYACFNALAVGAQAFSEPVNSNHAQDWIQTGIPPRDVIGQILLVKIYRHVPAILIYSAAFAGLYHFASVNSWYFNQNLNPFQLPALGLSLAVIQIYLIFASSCLGLLVNSTVGRFFIVFGYFLIHTVGPLVLLAIIEMTRLYNSMGGLLQGELYVHIAISSNLIGSTIYALTFSDADTFDFEPQQGYILNFAFLAGLSYLWFLWSVRLLIKRVMR